MGCKARAVLLALSALLTASAALAQFAFLPSVPRQVPNGPTYVAAGDFDNDGINDVAVAGTVRDRVTVLFGSALADYESVVEIPVGRLIRAITTGDFNGDGCLDIAATDVYTSRLFIVNGHCNGSFSAPVGFPTALRGPVSVATGNYDGRLGLDAVTANGDNNSFTIFLNQGGNRGLDPIGNFPVTSNPRVVVSYDMNGDRFDDIAILDTGMGGTDEVSVFLNTGTGSFEGVVPTKFAVGVGAKDMTTADFNSDGWRDLAVLNGIGSIPNSFSVSVLLLQANATFSVLPPQEFSCPSMLFGQPISCAPQSLAAADFDRDAREDIATSFSTRAADTDQEVAGFINAYTGRGDGHFDFAVQNIVGLGPRRIIAADVTGDAIADVTVAEFSANTVRTLRGQRTYCGPRPCVTGRCCLSGNCVDGACCATPFCPPGQRCDIFAPNTSELDGICRLPAPNGSFCAQDEQCESNHCVIDQDGSGNYIGFCCAQRTCPVDQFCNAGECRRPLSLGFFCTLGIQCASSFCTDGLCCSDPACPVNGACNISGHEGVCFTRLPPGSECTDSRQCCSELGQTDPTQCDPSLCLTHCCKAGDTQLCDPTTHECDEDGNCVARPTYTPTPLVEPTPLPVGSPCNLSQQCAIPFCVNRVCCIAPACPVGACNNPGEEGHCSVNAIGEACRESTGCAAPAVCVHGACMLPTPTPTPTCLGCPRTHPCNAASECESNNCVDNVCCETETCGDVLRCDIPGFEGFCQEPGLVGATCLANAHCARGLVCKDAACRPLSTPTRTPTYPPYSPTPVFVCSHRAGCAGDCNADHNVTVDEVIVLVNIGLETESREACTTADINGDCRITVDEIITAVNAVLNGCDFATPTPNRDPVLSIEINGDNIDQADTVRSNTANIDVIQNLCLMQNDLGGGMVTSEPFGQTRINAAFRSEQKEDILLNRLVVHFANPNVGFGDLEIPITGVIIGGRCSNATDRSCAAGSDCLIGSTPGTCGFSQTTIASIVFVDLVAKAAVQPGILGTAVPVLLMFKGADISGSHYQVTATYNVTFANFCNCPSDNLCLSRVEAASKVVGWRGLRD